MHSYIVVMIIACFLWAGFMGAISFMESWLKFRAEGVQVATGLSIGRLIFKALNRVEWIYLIILWGGYILAKPSPLPKDAIAYFILSVIMLIQTIFLLPAMDKRAVAKINGQKLGSSSLHIWYPGLELLKFIILIYAGISLLGIVK
ncbi:MAG: hypothetical protein ACRDE2_06020 [Chitinophagaceae bacterium]